ncbi:MAG: exodeoxyribonuclease VII large subunit [Lachnospiraceae bacterium]|nr:exodeoxyribonuclease VII large subunit [Lachnospiraceae bacterium]
MAGVYSVSQVNSYIRSMFSQDFALSRIAVKGEVSNCKYHTSGHIYFTLKDGGGSIGAVMFAGQRKGLEFRLRDGQQVVAKGSIDVYERDGKYQLYAREITLDGAGDLFRRFEALRDELEEMGMFDARYKRPIPRYAGKVGIVTASTGAAIRDIMNIAKRRNPYVQLILCPAQVQGEKAKYSIVKALERLDSMGLDIIIVGRGGGSIEDLWAFNEEIVARAIFACKTPVISAVGHETDVTIADYVADMRAPTPSAAAELAVFDYLQFAEQTAAFKEALIRSAERQVEKNRYRAGEYRYRLSLNHPQKKLDDRRQRAADIESEINRLVRDRLLEDRHRLALISGRLSGMSPLEKLSQGYGFLGDRDGKKVVSVRQIKPGDVLNIHIRDGRIRAVSEEVEEIDRSAGEAGKRNL